MKRARSVGLKKRPETVYEKKTCSRVKACKQGCVRRPRWLHRSLIASFFALCLCLKGEVCSLIEVLKNVFVTIGQVAGNS